MHEVFTFSWSEDTVERDPSFFFCCFFLFSEAVGWFVTMLWGFSDCDPPPTPLFNLKNQHPTTLPTTTTIFFPLLFGVAITLYFHCRSSGEPRWELSSPRLWHSSPPFGLWCYRPSQSYRYGDKHRSERENQKETEREKILLTVSH